jgi:hypothetical protein
MLDSWTGRRWLPVPLAAAGLAVLTACGGSDGAAPAEPSTAVSASSTASPEAFADCMTQQGVPAPEGGMRITGPAGGEPQGGTATRRNGPPPPPDGVDPEAWEAALETCGPLAPRRTITPTP